MIGVSFSNARKESIHQTFQLYSIAIEIIQVASYNRNNYMIQLQQCNII